MISDVKVTEEQIFVYLGTQTLKFPRLHLPEVFLHWQAEARLKMFDILENKGADVIKTHPAHLPVFATLGTSSFPINLTAKGIGLLPKLKYLEEFTTLFKDTQANADGQSWHDTLSLRVEAVRTFYSNLENFDRGILGGLEIFEGRTTQNLKNYPLASILYIGEAPKFPSYQFNGVVVFVDSENPYFRFLRAARELFAFDSFHIPQIRYPYGFLFHVVEILDKTPFPRR